MLPILKIVVITIMNHTISYNSSNSSDSVPFFFLPFFSFIFFPFSFLLGEKLSLVQYQGKSISHYRKAGVLYGFENY